MTKKALIVDDSRLACKVMAKMLDTLDFKCVEVYSAEEALEYLRFNQPDIIFLDHTMSGMDGLEVIKVIKNNPQTAQIPVMMYTAKEGDYYVGQAMALGAADVLPKGLEKKRLIKALKKVGMYSSELNSESGSESSYQPVLDSKTNLNLETVVIAGAEKNQETNATETESPQWLTFWKQRLQPYLEQQKNQQQKEFEYNTKQQTRSLIRDMHITLEQFEHALVLRMESHADFVSATEAVARSARRKWLSTIGALILVLQTGIIYSLWQADKVNQSLLFSQQQISQTQINQQELLNESLVQLKAQLKNSKASNQKTSSPNQLKKSVGLVENNNVNQGALINSFGDIVASLNLVDEAQGIYQGLTSRGYQFEMNNKGELGYALNNRYFISDDCSGENYVMAKKSTIYKGSNKSLWYVDKLAEPITLMIHSTLTLENDCVLISGEMMDLYSLQKNSSYETGLDESQSMRLSLKR